MRVKKGIILKEYKRSVKFTCVQCGNAQRAAKESHAHVRKTCSRCLAKEF